MVRTLPAIRQLLRVSPLVVFAALATLAIIGVSARVTLALWSSGNYDIQSYGIVADIVNRGGNVYAETIRYNYAPPWFVVTGLLDGNPVSIRLLLTGIDLATAALLATRSRTAAALFLANPVSIWITGYQGQFDSAAIALVLAAIVSGWWWLSGVAVIVKPSVALAPLFTLPFRRFSTRLLVLAGFGAVFILVLVPWLTSAEAVAGVVRNVVAYGAGAGPSAGGGLFEAMVRILLLGAVLALAIPRRDPVAGMLIWALATVAISPAAGPQLWVLPIAIGSFIGGRWLFAYTVVATVALAFDPNALALGPAIGWTVSLAALGWLAGIWVKPLIPLVLARVHVD